MDIASSELIALNKAVLFCIDMGFEPVSAFTLTIRSILDIVSGFFVLSVFSVFSFIGTIVFGFYHASINDADFSALLSLNSLKSKT